MPALAQQQIQPTGVKTVSSMALTTQSRLCTIAASADITQAAQLLSNTQISLLVVCNPRGGMEGVLTKTNLVQHMGSCGAKPGACIADLMTREVVSCNEAEPLETVLLMMGQRGLVHVPVIDSTRKPLGVLNARDALRELLENEIYQESLLRDYVMGVGYR